MTETKDTDEDIERLRKALVVPRERKVGELAEKAKGTLELDEQGTTYIRAPRDSLSDGQLISLHLAGKRLAHMIELSPTDSISREDLARVTGITAKVVSARISELRQRGRVEQGDRGEYRIVFGAIAEVLDEARGSGGRK